jgi:cell division transport system permease protein
MQRSQAGLVVRRAWSSLKARFRMHALIAGTMAMALFVFGIFMLAEENLQGLLKRWGDQVQIYAYLDKTLSAAEVSQLQERIQNFPEVERLRHISQAQAWKDFRAALGSQSSVLEGLPQDVLPPSFEIYVKPDHRDGPLVETLANRLRKEKAITAVEYPQEAVERLSLGILAFQWAKWAVSGALFVMAFFIVGSVVRLGIATRKDEIEIMQRLGAPEELIQASFVIEGMIQGIIGTGLSVLCLWSLWLLLRDQLPIAIGLLGVSGQLVFIDGRAIGLIAAMGGLLGASGNLFSLRRFTKT